MLKQWFGTQGRFLPLVAVACVGAIISALTFLTIHSLEVEKTKSMFQGVAEERFEDVESNLDLTVAEVVALGAHCESTGRITRKSFDAFTTPLLAVHDAEIIQALEWIPRVSLAERIPFERAIRAEGFPGFEIRDRGEQGGMVRSGNRPYYFPVAYIQPYKGNEIASGYDDSVAHTARHNVMVRAASSGELSVSQRFTLIQETSDQHGVLLLRPVYGRSGGNSGKKELLGFVAGVLRMGNIVERHGANSGVEVVITDLRASAAEQQLYPSRGRQLPATTDLTQYRNYSIGGRTWQLSASPAPGAFPVDMKYSYAGGGTCLLFTLLIAMRLVNTQNRHREVERLVEERTGALKAAMSSLAEVSRGLEESEMRYRRVVEDSPNGIVVERKGKIVLVNRAAAEMFNLDTIPDLENHSLLDFVSPERKENAEEVIRELYARETQVAVQETKLVRRDGSMIDAEVAASSFSHAGFQSVQIVLRDITQRKLSEAENARLIRAIEQVNESIVITDAQARIVYVNPSFERITGFSREEVLGQNPRILSSGRQSIEFYEALWCALSNGESWSGRFVNRRKNGRLYTEEAMISPVVDRLGEVINYVAVKRDVTLETELQEQLHQSQKMDAIGRLAGGVAHDFNNMLMVIISYAELLTSSLPNGDPLIKHTELISRAAHRSAALTRQLLAFSRKQVLAPQILDCNAIVSETSSMVRRIISENIDLKCDLAPDLWRVKADAGQIVQVILNLCVNSRDAMPNGGMLTLATRNYQVDEGFVELSVSDTGTGIPPEIQEKLFEPFFTTKERGKGTGLGLATVYGIVQQSGGHIRVESEMGQGTEFKIHLPRCTQSAVAPETPIEKRVVTGKNVVLVVEDERALREAIADHLRNQGYRVLTAVDGVEALEVLVLNSDVAILLSDLIMPRMGGRELGRIAVTRNPHLQIIYMSGYGDEETINAGGGDGLVYLQKPFTMDSLLVRIAESPRHLPHGAS